MERRRRGGAPPKQTFLLFQDLSMPTLIAVLLKESASFRKRVVSFRSDLDRFLAILTIFVPPASPRLPAGPVPGRRPARQPSPALYAARETRRRASTAWPGISRPFGHMPTLVAPFLPLTYCVHPEETPRVEELLGSTLRLPDQA
jgi:hypothetical protein